jgi:hypothetical protein
MAITTATVWEVQPFGSDLNGGGFDAALDGNDYTQAGGAQLTLTDLACTAGTSIVTSVQGGFTSQMVGNVIQISSGTNFTTGFYQITAWSSVTQVTLDRSPAPTLNGTAGNARVGGALASPGMASLAMATAGSTIYVKAGTYTVTSATANAAAGCVSLPAGTAGSPKRIIGYETTRGDECPTGNRPVIKADSVITTFTLVTLAQNGSMENIEVDGNLRTSSRGANGSNVGARFFNCVGRNCTNNGLIDTSGGYLVNCRTTGCTTASAMVASGYVIGCVSDANTSAGIQTFSCTVIDSIAMNNTGGASDGFQVSTSANSTFINCTSYGNGRMGFYMGTVNNYPVEFFNCLAVNNTSYGFQAAASYPNLWLRNCAAYNNTAGTVGPNIPTANKFNFQTLTANPFNNAAGGDFTLNYTAGGGAALMATGYPTAALPNTSTKTYRDIGAAQHQLGTVTVNTTGILTDPQPGLLSITQGDAYTQTPLRPLAFSEQAASNWPSSLATYVVTLFTREVETGTAGLSLTCAVISDSLVYAFPNSTQTGALAAGEHDYQLRATKGSEVWTLEQGRLTVLAKQA